jgi:hypothetical protein
MLTPRELELLTAYVDGTLSRREQRAVKRLVRARPEARRLLRSLLRDSREMQLLPAVPAPVDFATQVLSTIAQQPPRPVSTTPSVTTTTTTAPAPLRLAPRTPASLPATPVRWYWGYAAAAAVFLVVGGGSFLLHRPGPTPVASRPEGGTPLAKQTPSPTPEKPPVREPDPIVRELPAPRWQEFPPTVKVIPDEDAGEDPEEVDPPVRPRPLPQPNEVPRSPVLASPHQELPNQLERVEFALPRVHIFHGLDVPEQYRALRDQLALGSGYRVEIPTRDSTRGLERLRLALSAYKIQWTLPADVQARLKKAVRSDYALFLENVAPEDLLEALKQAGLADRTAAQKRPADLTFEGPLIVRETARVDRRELKDLLGIDPLSVRPTTASGGSGVNIHKSLQESTGATINETLDGRGIPRPGSTARGPSAGIVLALPPSRAKAPEVKRFLDSRPTARPGTLQVLIVLRNVN